MWRLRLTAMTFVYLWPSLFSQFHLRRSRIPHSHNSTILEPSTHTLRKPLLDLIIAVCCFMGGIALFRGKCLLVLAKQWAEKVAVT